MPIWLIQLVVGVVLSIGSTLIQQAFAPKPSTQQVRPSGFRGTAATGGDLPMSFVLGTLGLAGKLEYENTYGDVGGTPNAYLVGVYSLSDLPITGLTGLFVNGSSVTKGSTGHVTQGYPVTEYGNKLWWEFFDGSQTTANSFLTGAFGSDADRPWTTSMIGRGIAYVTMTALFDRNIWNGFPAYLFEVQGIPLYDVRKDSEAGGSGSHRLDDASTWEFSDNPIVAIYNILCGIKYGADWVWGMQDAIDQSRLPYDVWAAAMDACDEDVDLADGGTEKRFRIGREVKFDEQPADVIDELLVACNGRISEAAGIYTVVVGDPGSATGSFTDDDVLITETQTLDPFPALDQIVNGATATYLEPSQAWESKEAVPYYRSDLETADDGRRQLVGLTLNSVFSGTQAQRLLKSKVEDGRRFYRHVLSLPPVFGIYRPLSVVDYTSTRNGYNTKAFLVTALTEAPNGNVVAGLQEIDPADHDWTTADEQAISFAPLTTIKPPAQPMTGWTVAPYIFPDAAGTDRRIGIEVTFTGELPDVRAVRIQVRENFGDSNTVFDGEQPYDPSETDPVTRAVTWAGIVPNTDYEVRGKFLPFSGRDTDWSSWLAVTTANVPPVGAAEIIAAAQSVLTQLGQVRTLIEQFKQIGTTIEAADREHYSQHQSLVRSVSTQIGDVVASFDEVIETAVGPGSAIATSISSLYAAMGGNSAQANVQWTVQAAVTGYSSRYALQLAVDADGELREASMFGDVPADTAEPTRWVFIADQFAVATSISGALVTPFYISGGTVYIDNARIKDLTASNLAADAVTAGKLAAGSIDTSDLFVDGVAITEVIAANAITGTDYATYSDQNVNIGVTTDYGVIWSDTVTVDYGASVLVRFSLQQDVPSPNSSNFGNYDLVIRRNGSNIMTANNIVYDDNFGTTNFNIEAADSPGNGTHTYGLALVVRPTGGAAQFNLRYARSVIQRFKR